MQRTNAFTTFIAALRWAVVISTLLVIPIENMDVKAKLFAQDDYWPRLRQKEDKTQAPRLDNTALIANTVFG